MTRAEAIAMIEEALGLDAGAVRGDEALADVEWNSLASVSLIALADEQRQLELDAKAIARCTTVAELARVLGAP